ncbi:MAG: FKBP-type peptidyl-prolyl cis-trans isomerase, partial [Alphaproteobacteria bacterium]|nr:FKBP-type peptidyl-prolyl cis-trans isomerase [Alphaproteobacteria bacterium]
MKAFAALPIVLLACTSAPAGAADAASSLAATRAFLAQNAHRPGVRVTSSGLQYRILRSGFGPHPTQADTVQISYSTRLIDAKLIDTASPDLPAVLTVNNVLRGLGEALQLMQAGDHWELVIPPELAFGGKGTPDGTVPPNQALVFDITLMSVTRARAAQSQDASPFSLYGRE